MNGPPPNHRQVPNFQCTESSAAPAADTVLAVVGGSITLLLFALSGLSDTTDPRPKIALLAVPAFVLPASSAIYGHSQVHRCVAAKREALAAPPQPAPAPAAPLTWQPGERLAVVAARPPPCARPLTWLRPR